MRNILIADWRGSDKNYHRVVDVIHAMLSQKEDQEDHEVAKILNDHFSNAVRALNIDIPSECKNNESTISNDPIDNIISTFSSHPSIKLINENVIKGNFSFDIVDNCAVEKEIAALDSKKASMSTSIPPKFLKENSAICCKPLTYIINNGIMNSCFNGSLKCADLTPVHKADDTTDKINYRNISLLPVVSKIFEQLIQTQTSTYVENVLSPYFPR